MLDKCAKCNGRIVMGGQSWMDMPFCSDQCQRAFMIALVDQILPPKVVDEHVHQAFMAPCPSCGRPSSNDVYSATKVTGLVLLYNIEQEARLSCASCGRANRLYAAIHCLILGWWSPRAFFFNLFILPTNLVAAMFIRTPTEPSPALRELVKVSLAADLVTNIRDLAHTDERATDVPESFPDPRSLTEDKDRLNSSNSDVMLMAPHVPA